MKDGFFRVAAATPKVKVADPVHNREQICIMIEEGEKNGAGLMVFPELCLTAYTCGDLFLQDTLIRSAKKELKNIVTFTRGKQILVIVGLPWEHCGKLYNAAALICGGHLLAIIPKTNIPNYNEFYEQRYFTAGAKEPTVTDWEDDFVPIGTSILFKCKEIPELVVGAEICEDVWVPSPPSIHHAMAGATVIANCSASDEVVGKDAYRRELVGGQSARLICGYVYANAGDGESTQDLVFGGHNIIVEDGTVLAESARFETGIIYADMDLDRIVSERRRASTFPSAEYEKYVLLDFSLETGLMEYAQQKKMLRNIDSRPFVPHDEAERSSRCEEIFMIQAMGLKKRLEHTGVTHAVLGISGGLDSTLALLVTRRAFDLLGIDRKQIHAVTMPCFGTTDRTYQNACRMTEKLGASLTEIDIKKSVTQHFADIGHDMDDHDVTYENSQARERTQVLMDVANQVGGLVIGTGDMSELALGWATYNGDHMSMYGVNASVPKTLVRHLVRYCADTCGEPELAAVLLDVLDTPVSPELLPPEDGVISQKTEDLVGPYELHDFFLYYALRFGFMPSKIYRMALAAFEGEYNKEVIKKWLNVFYRRFFSQQFKRSCLPDGPKVGSVSVSPRGDLRMPSDASVRIWMDDLARIDG
ncbi:NAD(+) synthase [Clostridium sp. AN503]|uniref:NAD(+) synthase n=1 Tax=Clostridium sp. AN503 TaxID=3160598 RepID=UPI003459F7E1